MIALARSRPYLYLAPTLVLLVAFTYLPIERLVEMSLRAPGLGTSLGPWTGFATYSRLFHDPLFWRALVQTCVYVIVSVPFTMALALALALLLNQPLRGIGAFRTLYYTPVVMPTVAVAALALWLFNPNGGIVDYLFGRLGISPIPWLVSATWVVPTLISIAVWKNLGYYMLIYLAALQALPPPLFDAARLDGAGPVVRFFAITLPLLRPTTFFVSVVSLIGSFQVFDYINLMTQGGPSNSSNVLVYFAYQQGFSYLQLGAAAAVSLVMFALVLAVLGLVSWALNR
jgi:ABC-type sugar transport system permease subunit